jgi:LmbE family N-acetylglucosaminyl deacetylase
MSSRLRVLAMGVHPDDLEVYAGGLLLRLLGLGAELLPLVWTDGEAGTLQPLRGTRREEAERAFAAQGLRGRFLGLPDGGLEGLEEGELAKFLERELERARPKLLLGPEKRDSHPDHAALGRVLERVDSAQVRIIHWLGSDPGEIPNFFVGVEEVMEAKRAWIRMHASQLPGRGGPRAHLPGGRDLLERAEVRERRYGKLSGLGLAEPFLAKGRPERLCSLLGGCLFTGEES